MLQRAVSQRNSKEAINNKQKIYNTFKPSSQGKLPRDRSNGVRTYSSAFPRIPSRFATKLDFSTQSQRVLLQLSLVGINDRARIAGHTASIGRSESQSLLSVKQRDKVAKLVIQLSIRVLKTPSVHVNIKMMQKKKHLK